MDALNRAERHRPDFLSGHRWIRPRRAVIRETSLNRTDLETVIEDLYDGQYNDPHRVISFNPEERWSQDVSYDIAQELLKRIDRNDGEPRSVQSFIDLHLGEAPERQLALKLV